MLAILKIPFNTYYIKFVVPENIKTVSLYGLEMDY